MLGSRNLWIAGGEMLELGGHRIFVRQDGPAHGAPVTLLHGYPTSSHDWSLVAPTLGAAGMRVTTLDLLGFGASAKPRGDHYRIAEQATIVEKLWQHLGTESTALVAHDYSVSVAQELLARGTADITRIAWLNGGLYPDLYRPRPVQRLLNSPVGSLLAATIGERTYHRSIQASLGRRLDDAEVHELWLATSADSGLRIQRNLMRYIDERGANAARWVRALESYTGPMLFIWGPNDVNSGRHMLSRLQERLPHADFVVLDDEPATGHYPHLENPDAVVAELNRFLPAQRCDEGAGCVSEH
ncbi:alpha/beta fold hydrolase [Nocardia grenadensis]